MQQYEEAPSKIELEPLSKENARKAVLVEEIIEHWRKTHYVPDDKYGEIFDKYYAMSLSELIIWSEVRKSFK